MNSKTSCAVWATASKKPKNLAVCAMLAALSVIFARLIVPMPNAFTRFSIEAIPIVVAGLLFGPVAGGCVGFVADLVGCLFSGYGYNPLFCVPPILYGVLAGLLRFLIFKKTDLWRIVLIYLPPVVFGSILYQSCTLAAVYNSKGTFSASLSYFLTTRSIQFAVTLVIDAVLTWLLFRSRLFERAGLWKPAKEDDAQKEESSDSKVVIVNNQIVNNQTIVIKSRTKTNYYSSCPNCGASRTENAKVCQYCGTSLIKSEEKSDESDAS